MTTPIKTTELREKIASKYKLTFAFFCSLQGWKTTDLVPNGIMKEAERCEKPFIEGILSLFNSWLEEERAKQIGSEGDLEPLRLDLS